ncbi:type II toxin-antitoxin system HipA family toxin [Endozoicomonas sp. SESOKO1]|uniref:type II toxin-antitoxin system HipA family toxin n=1 Tax=Endozoicomonas sp. SESOKO1 TaxID=2828742 RepID=UPI002148D1E4|nr:HipA domain-containing protein [Endozoicomonas sp. SESOKO1]
MQRREAVLARQEGRRVQRLNESDYLLGVHDICRMGALRFKLSDSGPFLDSNERLAAPPFSSLRELEYAVSQIELNQDLDNPDYLKWLFMLISPGSSLGGARPKACVSDGDELWLAKFPSHYDGDDGASYLELAQFLIAQGANTQADLAQLWRRLAFNILVSNSDDHLRNHGFILADNASSGWLLSPAYDINVIQGATGLHLNIDDYSNELSLDLALEVAPYFQLSATQSKEILTELRSVTDNWQQYANEIGINRQEQQLLELILF